MRRRELLYSLLGVSCLPAFLEAQSGAEETPVLTLTSPDGVAHGLPAFFPRAELATFRHFGKVLVPASAGQPGAIEAGAPEFLDFLLSQSPSEVQSLYRNGVRKMDSLSTELFRRPFVKLDDSEIARILAPLSEPWTYRGPSDSFAQFLQAGKVAFWQATVNSKQWADAGSGRRRAAAGVNTYWLPFE